ncbi:hypothetical protein V6N12_040677 [Hibiscus sabdariffa]|uniref:Uncharacterized protein n=1 Tax=Hibiscus sabdariffa TaxID=183260 RepID=A0ABR2E4E0_9ROSI
MSATRTMPLRTSLLQLVSASSMSYGSSSFNKFATTEQESGPTCKTFTICFLQNREKYQNSENIGEKRRRTRLVKRKESTPASPQRLEGFTGLLDMPINLEMGDKNAVSDRSKQRSSPKRVYKGEEDDPKLWFNWRFCRLEKKGYVSSPDVDKVSLGLTL